MRESGEEEVTSAPRLVSLAKALLTSFADSFLLIDGLDECPVAEREALLRDLNDLTGSQTTTKVLILSRQEADIKKALVSYPSYAITSKDTSTDINRFVSDSLENPSSFKFHLKPQMKSEIQKQLSQSADGSFLWARLMVDTLKSHPLDEFDQVRDAVVNLPLGLSAAYGRVFVNLLQQPTEIQNLVSLVLRLLSTSFRPMTVTALLSALTRHGDIRWDSLKSEHNFQTLLEETIGTITQVTGEGTITFIHQSVLEFLTASTELWTDSHQNIVRFKVDTPDAHGMMAVRCLETLDSIVYTIDQDTVSVTHMPNDFISYSMEYWGEHISLSLRPNRETSNRIKAFLSSDQSLYWLKERLQTRAKEAVTIGQLIVLEHRLKEWAKKEPESDLHDAVVDFVQRLYEKWHARLVAKYGETSSITLRSSNLLGQILTNKGKYREATSVFEKQVSPACEDQSDRKSTDLSSLVGLAQVRQNQGNWEGAVSLLRVAVEGLKITLPPNDQRTLVAQGLLGAALVGASRHRVGEEKQALAEAECVLTETHKARTEILGASHPDTLEGLQTLAKLYSFQERFEDSKNAFLQYQEVAKKVLGLEHRNYMHSLDDLGVLYSKNGYSAQAEATLEYVSSIHKSVQGEKHPDTAWSFYRLGVLLREQGKLDRAVDALIPLSEISGGIYGETSRYCLMSKYQLALAYDALRLDPKSRPLFEHVVENIDYGNKVSVEMGCVSAPKLADIYERAGQNRRAQKLRQKSWILGQEPPKRFGPDFRSLAGWVFHTGLPFKVVVIVLLIVFNLPLVWFFCSERRFPRL
jgi:tetratricopeptide (TPR) repeat protein